MYRWILLFICLPVTLSAGTLLSRRVIAFWDSKTDESVEESMVGKMIEFPLNHMGIDVEYHDIQDPLPDIQQRPDIRGVIICFNAGVLVKDPVGLIEWTIDALEMGKKAVILRNPGFMASSTGKYTPTETINRLYERLGFTTTNVMIDYPYDYKIVYKDPAYTGFEREFPDPLPSFTVNKVLSSNARSLLRVGLPGKPETESDLMVINPYGGYISEKFTANFDLQDVQKHPRSQGWYINPFTFLEAALGLSSIPAADVTTLAGRRIFISYCDGDSWTLITEIERYRDQGVLCSEVTLKEIVEPNPDIPMAMGVIGADVDKDWIGTNRSQRIAREFFAQPQVEAATHSYSHPFQWTFFEDDQGGKKEINFLHMYPYGSWQNSFISWFRSKFYEQFSPKEFAQLKLKWGYVIPRAYAHEPFNLDLEIQGSADFLNQFMPAGEYVHLMLWSGDGLPWDKPVELCYEHGLANLGGGFNRFDAEFPSVLYLSPLGRRPGGWVQIYSPMNAEFQYTFDWSKRFYGFRYLPVTFQNTEKPRRLKPAVVYYHSYSGQFQDSLQAVLDNIAYIRTQKVISIWPSHYVKIGRGFYSIAYEKLGDGTWRIKDRGELQTIRFDHAPQVKVDLLNSLGVVGFTHFQNSLYVYLDSSVAEPVIQLATQASNSLPPYLVEGSWVAWNLLRREDGVKFKTQGWGKLDMKWHVPQAGRYLVRVEMPSHDDQQVEVDTDRNVLSFSFELPYNVEADVTVVRMK